MTIERNESESLFSRRKFLGAFGASAAVVAGGTQLASAKEGGYGSAGYGAGPYGGGDGITSDIQLAVETVGGTDIDSSSATVIGDLTELSGTESALVHLEWGTTTSFSQSTEEQRIDSTGEFEAELSNLESDTEYKLQAVATADGIRETGGVATFATAPDTDDGEDAVPEIEMLTGEDVSNPRNPHVDAELEWEASIADSELWAGQLTLADDEETYGTWTYDLSGEHAEASETKRVPLGALDQGTEYTVELVLYSYYGNTAEEKITFESQ